MAVKYQALLHVHDGYEHSSPYTYDLHATTLETAIAEAKSLAEGKTNKYDTCELIMVFPVDGTVYVHEELY